ncbi:MAG TPA: AAA family ATPase [Gemmataceae bacterium]|nr:AAA family ATPase [Gemmataceae bacterium]
MYESHFGLHRRPFAAIADSGDYYPATSHEQALTQLQQAIQDDEGFALLTGEPGTGKTIACHCLLDRLGDAVTDAFLTHSHFPDRASLLQALLYDLGLPHESQSEQELRLSLTDFLLKNYENGRRTVLVLDEAQHLGADLLEELRLLGNLEGRGGRAVQVVLSAQPVIRATLRLPQLAALSQRLAVCPRLDPLGLHEAADYLVHHLRAAGGRPERIVSDEALEILARGTRGIPRLLNRAMHQALTLACTATAGLVDAEAAIEALGVLGLVSEQDEPGEAIVADPLARVEEECDLAEEKTEPVVPFEEATGRLSERAPFALQDPNGPRRPSASPRRPA